MNLKLSDKDVETLKELLNDWAEQCSLSDDMAYHEPTPPHLTEFAEKLWKKLDK